MRAPSRGCYRPVFWKRIKKKGAHYTTATRGASVARALLNAFDWGGKTKPGDPHRQTRVDCQAERLCVNVVHRFLFFPQCVFSLLSICKIFRLHLFLEEANYKSGESYHTCAAHTGYYIHYFYCHHSDLWLCVNCVYHFNLVCIWSPWPPPPSLWFDWITYRKEVYLFHHRHHIFSAKFEEYSFLGE